MFEKGDFLVSDGIDFDCKKVKVYSKFIEYIKPKHYGKTVLDCVVLSEGIKVLSTAKDFTVVYPGFTIGSGKC